MYATKNKCKMTSTLLHTQASSVYCNSVPKTGVSLILQWRQFWFNSFHTCGVNELQRWVRFTNKARLRKVVRREMYPCVCTETGSLRSLVKIMDYQPWLLFKAVHPHPTPTASWKGHKPRINKAVGADGKVPKLDRNFGHKFSLILHFFWKRTWDLRKQRNAINFKKIYLKGLALLSVRGNQSQ